MVFQNEKGKNSVMVQQLLSLSLYLSLCIYTWSSKELRDSRQAYVEWLTDCIVLTSFYLCRCKDREECVLQFSLALGS